MCYIEELDKLLNKIIIAKEKKALMEAMLLKHGNSYDNINDMLSHYTNIITGLECKCDCLCIEEYVDPSAIPF